MLGESRRTDSHREAIPGRILRKTKEPEKPVDYRRHRLERNDWFFSVAVSLLLTALISNLFYRSVYGMIIWPVLLAGTCLTRKRSREEQRRLSLRKQFGECIRIVTASLYAGYSVENAFREAERELNELFGEQADLCREVRVINSQIRLNIPAEKLLMDLGIRSGVEEIAGFGRVFGYAKRNSGDFIRILKDAGERIAQKSQAEAEVEVMIASRRLELRIMNLIPLGILLFVQITSPDFLNLLYEGIAGRCIMSIFLLLYGAAYLLSVKLSDIKI